MDYKNIFEKKKIYLENKHIINERSMSSLERAFDISYTHNSTAIEGNTLTLIETKVLLEDKISIGGKNIREIYEVVNHNKAYNYVKECIAKNNQLTENTVKDIHQILMENIITGGIYRNISVYISGAMHTPPTPNKMYEQIKIFFSELPYKKELNEIELAAYTHAEFVRIHPFEDGNGRTSRLIMNYQLMLNGLCPVVIKKEDRMVYFNALEEYAINKNLKPFCSMIAGLVEERLDSYIELINEQKALQENVINIDMK